MTGLLPCLSSMTTLYKSCLCTCARFKTRDVWNELFRMREVAITPEILLLPTQRPLPLPIPHPMSRGRPQSDGDQHRHEPYGASKCKGRAVNHIVPIILSRRCTRFRCSSACLISGLWLELFNLPPGNRRCSTTTLIVMQIFSDRSGRESSE